MKKLLVVLGLALAAFSFQASAATFDLGLVDNTATFGNKITENAAFSDDWSFTVPTNGGAAVAINNAIVNKLGKIKDFAATLDGQALTFEQDGDTQELHGLFGALDTSIIHHLVISGSGITGKNASYGGSIAVITPIPAAAWLFGSALMGLMGTKRRKAA